MANYTPLQEKQIREILNAYNLTLLEFEPLAGGNSSSSYCIHTSCGDYVLSVLDSISFDQAVMYGKLLQMLEEYDFPTNRLLAPAKEGFVTQYQGAPVIMKRYIVGQVERDLGLKMLHQVGTAMARLHQLPVPDFLPNQFPDGRQCFPGIIGCNIDPAYERWLAKQATYLEQHIPAKLPRGLIHGDFFEDNLLFEGRQLKAVIDFEVACFYFKVFDLGMGIVGLCADRTNVALDKTRALVNGYQQIRKLEEIEKESLQLFVEYAATAISYWRFWKYHIDTPGADKADKHWEMARLADGVGNLAKATFLKAVFR